ncbi:MAG: hypothetical protein ABSF74_01340 [Dehalococcoidia bacterium]
MRITFDNFHNYLEYARNKKKGRDTAHDAIQNIGRGCKAGMKDQITKSADVNDMG